MKDKPTNLQDALRIYSAEFNYDTDTGTWCLSGTDNGNGWETDDYEADSRAQAESDALDYLIEYNS